MMSNNKLLTETTIRRFMKLANVGSLTNNFLNEEEEKDEDEPVTEQDEPEMDEDPEMDDDLDADDELDMDDDLDVDDELDMGAEPGAADISLTEEEANLLIDLGERLSAAMGSEDEESEMDDEAPEMDDEAPVDVDAELDLGAEGEEDPGMRDYAMQENKKAIVKEVLKRVTKRIVSERLKR